MNLCGRDRYARYCIKACAGRHVLLVSAHFLLALPCESEYRGRSQSHVIDDAR
jgi:hypothetical protein